MTITHFPSFREPTMSDSAALSPLRSMSPLRLVTLLITSAGCGLAFAGGCFLWTTGNLSVAVDGLSPDRLRLMIDAGFLAGFSFGLLSAESALRRFSLCFLWCTVLTALTTFSLLTTAELPPAQIRQSLSLLLAGRTIAGTAAAVCWISGGEIIRAAIPNNLRWRTTSLTQAALFSFGLLTALWSLFSAAPDSAQYRMLLLLTGISSVLLSALTFRGLIREQRFSTAPVPSGSSADSCCSVASAHDHDHDHDFRSAGDGVSSTERRNDGSSECPESECCGGMSSRMIPAPRWVGCALSVAAFLMLFGPLMSIQVRGTDATTLSRWIAGLSMIAGVWLFRTGAGQMGYAMTLPLFLMIAAAATPLLLAVNSALVSAVLLFFSTAALAGAVDGLIALVRESFVDDTASSPGVSENIPSRLHAHGMLAAGSAMTAAVLWYVSSVQPKTQVTIFLGMVPVLCCVMAGWSLRSIPQPLVVTRFAERYLKPVVHEH